MEKIDSKRSFLFFHMGPGFHSQIEAAAFKDKYPHVIFLDQPLDVSYLGLFQWAEQTILHYADKAQQPLTLLGHSFGGYVIRGTLPMVSDKVAEIRLLNSAFDPFDCFVNLQTVLGLGNFNSAYWKSRTTEEKLQLIFQIAQNPNMPDSYWSNREAQKDYSDRAVNFPSLNLESFVRVFSEYLSHSPLPDFAWQGTTKILYALSDRLIQRPEVVSPWKQVFPLAQFTDLDQVGHYAHFESPAVAELFFSQDSSL